MKTVKIVSAITSSIIFVLIALAISLEDPLKFKYEKTVDKIMKTERMGSEAELLEKYPALKEAKNSIAKADNLKTQICSKTSGNKPSLTKAEENELEKMQKELLKTRQKVEQLLKDLTPTEAIAVISLAFSDSKNLLKQLSHDTQTIFENSRNWRGRPTYNSADH